METREKKYTKLLFLPFSVYRSHKNDFFFKNFYKLNVAYTSEVFFTRRLMKTFIQSVDIMKFQK